MSKLTTYAGGILAATALAAGMGAVTAPAASAAPLPPYDCAIAVPLLDQLNPIVVGAVGCKDNTEKFLAEHAPKGGDKGGPGKSEEAPGQNK